jgi:CrcB protein
MLIILGIGIGSFFGGILRYLLSSFIQSKFESSYPFGTMLVNIIGCFFIGVIYAYFEKGALSQEWRMILITGLLGGFTTFSAFSMETVNLLYDGQFLYAGLYVVLSILIGIFFTFLGIIIVR